jgi:hypothetical protein
MLLEPQDLGTADDVATTEAHLARAAHLPLEMGYDEDEGDDDTEVSDEPNEDAATGGDTPLSRPPAPSQPPQSIVKTILGRLLGRRPSEARHFLYCASTPYSTFGVGGAAWNMGHYLTHA